MEIKNIFCFNISKTSIILCGLLICCSPAAPDNTTIKNLDSKQALNLIDKNQNNPDFIILDVRTPEEYNSGHIINAVNIDYKSGNFKEDINKLSKDKVYTVYCRSGRRAALSSEIMGNLGFKYIYDIGGILQLQEAGYKITKPGSE